MGTALGIVADRLAVELAPADRALVIEDVHHDSRDVTPASLFAAIAGANIDGHAFAHDVVGAGASAIVAERDIDVPVPVLVVPDSRFAMAVAARAVHGDPDERMSIVGVTGTNGKTTVVHLCEAIWESVGRSHGIVGTLGARFAGSPVDLERTTPESSDLQRLLGRMASAGVHSVAMEVSSHALELRRADAIHFTAVGFTNLTQDHLDFHGTMEAYLAAKQRLFEDDRADHAVIDVGSEAGRATAESTRLTTTTVGVGISADIRADQLRATPIGTEFRVTIAGRSFPAMVPLVGSFNVANALVAVGLTIADGVESRDAVAGIATVPPIRGRMELVPHTGEFAVIVDYAHTPDAVAAVVASIPAREAQRRIVIVGAGGDRDRGKRHAMGLAAGSGADIVIVTNDNPRTEDPVDIARSIQEGALAAGRADVRVVLDRTEAIAAAIDVAQPGDIVMILGKGHEQGQDIGGTVHPFDDAAVARSLLQGRP